MYSNLVLSVSTGCAREDFALATSGAFLYQPGCNGSPLWRGKTTGTGVSILYESDMVSQSPLHVDNFLCLARDPSGGFFVMTEGVDSKDLNLFHVDESATPTTGFKAIPTSPSLNDAAAAQSETLTFRHCSMAVSANGTIYVQTFRQLWRIAP